MVKFLSIIFLICVFPAYGLCQTVETVSGEYTYNVPGNVSLNEAKNIALERAKLQLIAEKFGTDIVSEHSTQIINNNNESRVDQIIVGNSHIKGEWIETIGEPKYKIMADNDMVVVTVSVKGKIRKINRAKIDLETLVLKNGTEKKDFASNYFKNGDDMFLWFQSPVGGYVAVYLVDNDHNAFCLLPYRTQKTGYVEVEADKEYVFFSISRSTEELRPYVDEYNLTCSHTQELNRLYVIFSPNQFYKAKDNQMADELPRELPEEDFLKWLSSSRIKDKQMQCEEITINIKQ